MSFHIVSIDTPQCSLTCKDGQLIRRAPGEPDKSLPLEDVASIIITSFSASIHSQLFVEAARHGVALIICESFKPVSLVLPANRSTDTLLSRALLKLDARDTARLWQSTVDAKCRNQFILAEKLAAGRHHPANPPALDLLRAPRGAANRTRRAFAPSCFGRSSGARWAKTSFPGTGAAAG